MTTLPAVVTIVDLDQLPATAATSTMLFEVVATVGGIANSYKVPFSAMATTTFGNLPAGGATGQILDKASGTDFASQWVNLSSLLTAGAGLSTSGSTAVVVSLATTAGPSVIGVAGAATAAPAAIPGTAAQVLVVNDGGTGLVFGQVNLASSAAVKGVLPGANMSAIDLAAPGAGGVQGRLPVPSGGTNTTTFTAWGVVFANGTASLGATAAATSGFLLTATGTTSAPNFQAFNLGSSIGTGVIGVPNGGTNTSTLTPFGVVYGSGTSTVGITAAGTTGWPLVGNGTAAAAAFQQLNLGSTTFTGILPAAKLTTTLNNTFFHSGSPWYDVRAYGAAGDGSTDDTAAIQAAIDAAVSGGIIYFPLGSYAIKTAGGFTGSVNGLRFIGESGQGGVLLTTTGVDTKILTINADSISVENLDFLGPGVNCAVTSSCIVINSIGVRAYIHHCVMAGGYCGVDNAAPYTFMNFCKISGTYGPALVRIRGTSAGMYGYGNQLDQAWPVSTPTAVSLASISARAGTTGYVVGDIVSSGGYYIQCRVNGTSASGAPTLQNYGTDISDGALLKWRLVAPTSFNGILIDTGAINNVFTLCDMTGAFSAGALLNNSLSGTGPITTEFNECTFANYIQAGIQANSGKSLIVRDCQVQNGVLTGSEGIYLATGWSEEAIIDGNQIYITATGIFLQAGTQTKISGNQIFGNTTGILVAANITDFLIVDNLCGSSAAFGANTTAINVSAGTSDYYVIANNDTHGAGTELTDGGTGTHKSVPGQILGTQTNNTANVGYVGEIITANLANASATALSNGAAKDITSVSLTAGDWDADGFVFIQPTATTTISFLTGWLSTTSATLPASPPEPNSGGLFWLTVTFSQGQNQGLPTGTKRFSLATTATLFLSCQCSFAASTNAAYGFLRARRVR